MRSLIISSGADTGGQNIRWKQAADRHPDLGLQARSVVSTVNSIKYPTDILWAGNGGAVQRLYDAADVVHLNNHSTAYARLDHGQRKPGLIHHHGSIFRAAPEQHMAIAKKLGFEVAVSTLDLTEPDPDRIHWLPAPYNLDSLRSIRDANRREPDGKVRIATAPTNRRKDALYPNGPKSTELLIEAVTHLQDEGYPIELEIIEGVTWAECLRRKAAADIYFDQVILGYGCNAIEAWGMGIPVIAGAQPWTLRRMKAEFGELPFYEATEQTIADAIVALLDSDTRAEYAERGAAHAQRFHAERPAVERLLELYQRAIDRRKPRARRRRAPQEVAA